MLTNKLEPILILSLEKIKNLSQIFLLHIIPFFLFNFILTLFIDYLNLFIFISFEKNF